MSTAGEEDSHLKPSRPESVRSSDDRDFHEHLIPDEDKARIVERHLVLSDSNPNTPADEEAGPILADTASGAGRSGFSGIEEYQAPHATQGGAITEDLYRWAHNQRRSRLVRSESMSLPNRSSIEPPIDIETIKQPGGFRRFFLFNQATTQGRAPPPALRSFVDFLTLYGHFAGESLEDIDNYDEEEDEPGASQFQIGAGRSETSRLLPGPIPGTDLPRRTLGGRIRKVRPRGEATVTQAVMMLLKSFVGTGILFLGKAFFNGGLLFSTVVLVVIALISLWSFLLLVQVNLKYPLSFGDMGGYLYGPRMRFAILTSIVVSQLGFVAAYSVFVAESMQAFVLAVTQCRTLVPRAYIIIAQCLLFLPLSLVRRIAKLSWTALVADVFILFGIIYLFYFEIGTLVTDGLADVVMFNKQSFPLLIGTAVFTFEGIGLVIPITESMKEPERFPSALSAVMAVVVVLFSASGALSYATFGSKIQTVVITNLPQHSHFVQAIQVLYSCAIFLSMPLQLFPALSILELGLFRRSGKYHWRTKMGKNLFRCFIVGASMFVAWLGANDLDKFVSLIGSLACVPLCFVYPALLHWKACANTRRAQILDGLLLLFGIFCVVFAGSQTVQMLMSGGSAPQDPVCIPPK
ncbi:hypothetical protein MCUN1_000053 [Malassezia cuniculi]|uniref:Amino acid transporter transmembrane domain-containing protein n=1 Tax=Malassezia cuniculi TaxID=948313 RepID=A0AAF0J4N7_9BASI|nr:hypothetical protein MCUN1_000053 [Malassezia cuniculi]